MKQWFVGTLIFVLTFTIPCGVAQAQYRPPASPKPQPSSEEEEMEKPIDLQHLRKGRLEWDTQEMIITSTNALHREHVQILKRLKELEGKIDRLKAPEKAQAKP